MRWLVWLAFGALVYFAMRSRARAMQENLRRAAREHVDAQAGSGSPFAPPSSAPISAENMVACSYCQLYLPASEAISRMNDHFCCEEHAQLHVTGVIHSPTSSASSQKSAE